MKVTLLSNEVLNCSAIFEERTSQLGRSLNTNTYLAATSLGFLSVKVKGGMTDRKGVDQTQPLTECVSVDLDRQYRIPTRHGPLYGISGILLQTPFSSYVLKPHK